MTADRTILTTAPPPATLGTALDQSAIEELVPASARRPRKERSTRPFSK